MKKKPAPMVFLSLFSSILFIFLPKLLYQRNMVFAQTFSSKIQPTVFVAAFPFGAPLHNPAEWTNRLIADLRTGSTYYGYKDEGSRPFVDFQIHGGQIVDESSWIPPKLPGGNYDYGAIYDYYNLCALIQQEEVDEVWFWDAGQGGFFEYVINGPEWSRDAYWVNAPNCGRQIATMTFNYNREIDVALESFSHRMEGTYMHYFPCDFYTETWPWTGWPHQCTGLVSDRYGFVGRPFSGNDYIGVCGDVHHPPNILDEREYIWEDAATVQSICEDWQGDGTAQISSINCQRWGCDHRRYHLWWMQNVPGFNNDNHDKEGNLQPNWWWFLFDIQLFGDLSQDGNINFQDLKLLLENWGDSPVKPQADLNGDGLVNGIDFGKMVELI